MNCRCNLPSLGNEFISLLGSRGTMDIMFIFCCTQQTLRFTELNNHLNHISTKTLSIRLKQLEKEGILNRTAYNEVPPRVEYSITEKGQKLVNSLIPLVNWIIVNQNHNETS